MSEESEMSEQDAHIRALLAELGSGPEGEALPPAVADRLDDTLARLVAEREQGGPAPTPEDATVADEDSGGASVLPMRRRWVPRATAAAAAVVVLGVGGVAAASFGLLGNGASDDSGGTSAATADKALPEAARSLSSPTPKTPDQSEALGGAVALPELTSASFDQQVGDLLAADALGTPGDGSESSASPQSRPSAGADPSGDADGQPDPQADEQGRPADSSRLAGCPGPEITDGGVPNAVRYDGRLAVLVVHPERDGERLVEAWNCAGDQRLASTTTAR